MVSGALQVSLSCCTLLQLPQSYAECRIRTVVNENEWTDKDAKYSMRNNMNSQTMWTDFRYDRIIHQKKLALATNAVRVCGGA